MRTRKELSSIRQRFNLAASLESSIISTLAILTMATLALLASPAWAQISSVSGDMKVVSQTDIIAAGSVDGATQADNQKMRVILEQQEVSLLSAMVLNITSDGTYGTPLSPGLVEAGQYVTSVLIRCGPDQDGSHANLVGAIEFNTEILGVAVGGSSLEAWDSVVGLVGVDYSSGSLDRGLELSDSDQIVVAGNRLELDLDMGLDLDVIRVILPTPSRGVSFSIEAHGASWGLLPAFGPGPMRGGDILTPGDAGAPGPNRPIMGPMGAPGVMLEPTDLGVMAYALDDVKEIDALSFGHDRGRGIRFSVDEYAIGASSALWPNVYSEGATGNQEASADVFAYRAPLAPTDASFTPGNRSVLDGNGVAPTGRPGFGLIEPNIPTVHTPEDEGDNLDALDLGTTTGQLSGRVYFSLDGTFADWIEASLIAPPGYGSAAANGVNGADVLVSVVGSGTFNIYADAATLGLGCNGECEDDIDALSVRDNGDGIFNQQDNPIPGNPDEDHILFSLRRGSGSLGRLDTRLGIPITESDILAPGPAIIIPGESLGLVTGRYAPTNSPYNVPDDLDALSRVRLKGAPVSQNDNPSGIIGQILVIDVLANDSALIGALDPASVVIFGEPEFGEIVWINSQSGEIHFRLMGGATMDQFSYVVRDDQGQSSDVTTVSVSMALSDAPDGLRSGRKTRFALAGPNPMHGQTMFKLAPSQSGNASVEIFTLAGRKVRTLLDGFLEAGEVRNLTWDGRGDDGRSTAAGMYVVRLKSLNEVQMIRVVRMK